ncbi:MAG TPA: VWA domain-containing protein [Bryobacteraceae bacterium]|nr:VWA domain-containing protein [Bryobacteraceae bacterium]
MIRAGLAYALFLATAGVLLIRAQDPSPAPESSDQTIRTTVNVVMAPVTVLDRRGDYVDGLQPEDFKLLDNGKEQKIKVDVAFQPISMVIAVQANDHVEGMLPKINKIGALIQPLVIGDQGEAAVLAFDHRFRKMQDFTSDADKIEAAIKKITPGSSSSRLIDAVIESVRMLRSRPANRRRILLLIAETRDKGSEGRVRDALNDVQMNNVSVYSVDVSRAIAGLTSRPADPRPNTLPPAMTPMPSNVPATPTTVMQTTGSEGGSAQFVPMFVEIFKDAKGIFVDNPVEVFTKGTGGTEFSFGKQRGLEDAIGKIGAEIHSQYLISYNPNNKDEGGFHEIEVDVNRRDVKVRTRPGYWLASLTK